MTTTLQPKLRGIFLTDVMSDNLTNPVGDFFSMIGSAVTNFFLYLIHLLTDPVVNFFSTIISAVTNFFHYLINSFNQAIESLTNPIVDFFSTVVSSVTNSFHYLINLFTQVFESLTDSVGEVFTKAGSAVTDFFHYLINLFNQEFPPEKRDEQIQSLIYCATYYLLPVVVLVTVVTVVYYCSSCLCSCIRFILDGCLTAVKSLFSCIRFIIDRCVTGVRSFYGFIFPYLSSGTEIGVKMMKAPGQPLLRISRAAFEANAAGYFLSLRGLPNNFVS